MNQVRSRRSRPWWVNAHDTGTKNDKHNRGYQAYDHTGNHARRVEAFPEEREDNGWHIRAGGNGECKTNQESNILVAQSNSQDNSHYTNDTCSNLRNQNLLTFILFTALDDVD